MALLAIAARNLLRYQRRTVLTASLITLGVLAVLLFVSVAGSFRGMMIGQITDAMLGHLQIHHRGYVESTENMPLHLNLGPDQVQALTARLTTMPEVEAVSARIKFGAMLSNFTETTSIRLTAMDPEQELATVPLLGGRVQGTDPRQLARGEILLPDVLARGLKINPKDTVVLVATNRDGSVNGQTFLVAGFVEGLSGPGGRDGYLHLADARELLRLEQAEITEIAVRLKRPEHTDRVVGQLRLALGAGKQGQGAGQGQGPGAGAGVGSGPAGAGAGSGATPDGKPAPLEVHTWDQLSPFSTIAKMIDLLTLFVQIMLVSIVLISVMNVMMMAVYERVREIGTLAAIGVRPRSILLLFLLEGLLLGVIGAVAGVLLSYGVVGVLDLADLTFSFGRQEGLLLTPVLDAATVAMVGLAVVLVSALASLQPSIKASRLDPISALRHV